MVQRGLPGAIVNVSSLPENTLYSTSKAGLDSYAEQIDGLGP